MNTMNIIENLENEAKLLDSKIEKLFEVNNFLLKEQTSLMKSMTEKLNATLKDSSLSDDCADYMDFGYRRHEKMHEAMHENSILIREYQDIRRHLLEIAEKLSENPTSVSSFVFALICVLKEMQTMNETALTKHISFSGALRANREIEDICFYLQNMLDLTVHKDTAFELHDLQ